MANSARQTILDYISSTLFPSITTGGGYNFTVATSLRGLQSYENQPDTFFPALFVASADEEREYITNRDFKSKMTVHIYGGVKALSGHVQVELDKLIEDVQKAFSNDLSMGSRAAHAIVKTITTDDGDQEPFAFFRMDVDILYKSVGTAP